MLLGWWLGTRPAELSANERGELFGRLDCTPTLLACRSSTNLTGKQVQYCTGVVNCRSAWRELEYVGGHSFKV